MTKIISLKVSPLPPTPKGETRADAQLPPAPEEETRADDHLITDHQITK